MKTITEFNSAFVNQAIKQHQDLTAAGKTAEELPAALGEALKVEGDRLTHLVALLEILAGKTNDLKRVIVMALTETDKKPANIVEKNGSFYLLEYFAPVAGKGKFGDKRSDDRGKGRGGRGGKGGRDDKKRGDRNRRPRRDAPPGEAGTPPSSTEAAAAGARPPRRDRPPRKPRAPFDDSPKKPIFDGRKPPVAPLTPITKKPADPAAAEATPPAAPPSTAESANT